MVRVVVVLLLAVASLVAVVPAHARALAVAWNDPATGRGALAAMAVTVPFDFVTGVIETGRDVVLHARGSRLYAISRTDATLTVVDQRRWDVVRTYTLPAGSSPEDVAVTSGEVAWITRTGASRLLRLDLRTGTTTESVDLGVFGDGEGAPDLGRMAVVRNRLFVQVRRLDGNEPGGFLAPALLAVVDPRRETLVDVDATQAGVQAIVLAGTPPRMRMQVMKRELFISATGGFFDAGGIEAVDLKTLASTGLVVREADGTVGADLGAFVLVAPGRGFLTFSTDLLLSSHLTQFDVHGHIGPQLHVSLDYFAPALAHDRGGVVFLPDGNIGATGVRAFDDENGAELTASATATSGAPVDLLAIAHTPK
ncbi:MAG TPA: hypothetical protein VGR62_10890 [Candidatus Binatia bacterium]|jgi:hypothetical protein|nr:hypothetical protein [Candidatus Binatia bacterium]